MLGHAKASMTLDVYADLFDDDLDVVADRLNAAIRSDPICCVLSAYWRRIGCPRRTVKVALTCWNRVELRGFEPLD